MSSDFKTLCAAAAESIRMAADELLRDVTARKKKVHTIEFGTNQALEEVLNRWIQNPDNVKQVERKIGSTPTQATLRARMENYSAAVYTQNEKGWTRLSHPDKHVVLIALDDLDASNGFSNWTGGPPGLAQGEWIQRSGDVVLQFSGQRGGLYLILIFPKGQRAMSLAAYAIC